MYFYLVTIVLTTYFPVSQQRHIILFGFFGEASHFLSKSTHFFFKWHVIGSLSSQLVSNEPGVLLNCAKR